MIYWFAGGRSLDEAAWASWMAREIGALGPNDVVAVGCATGADRLAARYAVKRGLRVIVAAVSKKATGWPRLAALAGAKVHWGVGGGQLAGRTRWLAGKVAAAGGVLVALPGGAGTRLSIKLARAAGLRVRVVRDEKAGGEAPPLMSWDHLGHTGPFVEYPRYDIPNALVYLVGVRPLASPAKIQGNRSALGHSEDYFGHPVPKRVRRARYMTCMCGGLSLHFTDGWCSCWVCRQETNALPQIEKDILAVATWACGDQEADEHREIADDAAMMGWQDLENNLGDGLTHLEDNDSENLDLVIHDLWGEWAGMDDMLAA
jgi:hypothetical protein